MSAYAYIGLQGSGKSLKAVDKLYNNFINPKTKDKSEYDCALTNINEFDFSKSDKINKLDFDELYDNLTILHSIRVLDNETDSVLNEKAKELNLFNCLIIIDEAPHYLTKEKDEVLLWWIEYHRHMHQDIILITPNKARFRTEYRNSIHYFVKSTSAKYRLVKSVYRYAVFSNYNMNKDDFEHFESFKVKKELFSLYVSGKAINGTPIIYYYLAAIIVIVTLLIFFSIYFIKQFNPKENKKEIETQQALELANSETLKEVSEGKPLSLRGTPLNSEIVKDEDEKLFKVKCKNDLCYISFDGFIYEFPFQFFENIIKNIDSSKLQIVQTKPLRTFYLLTNENNFNFIIRKNQNKGTSNENTKNDSNIFSINK
jgi:zona occludens toxin